MKSWLILGLLLLPFGQRSSAQESSTLFILDSQEFGKVVYIGKTLALLHSKTDTKLADIAGQKGDLNARDKWTQQAASADSPMAQYREIVKSLNVYGKTLLKQPWSADGAITPPALKGTAVVLIVAADKMRGCVLEPEDAQGPIPAFSLMPKLEDLDDLSSVDAFLSKSRGRTN